jgi:chromate reductase, NAD(P)H dehydrogenase (quinone)
MTRILLISGSTLDGSLPTAALRTAARFAPAGVTATRYDGLRGLPAFVPGETPPPGPVARLRRLAAASDAVLFSTPEFAGSLPGSLKNLIDWLVDGGDLAGKPAAWLSVAASGHDDGAVAGLESVLGHAGARVLQSACIRVPLGPESVDAQGMVADPRLHRALADMVQALARALAAPEDRRQPSWQAYSSLYPVVPQRDMSTVRRRRPTAWPGPGDGM